LKLLITTQVYENYGAHDWDGVGACPQYWKAKGGSDYVVKKINVNKVTETVMGVRSQIEQDNDAFRETIIDWEIVADDALTEFEQSQLNYEGVIRYASKEIAW
jgi:predicted transcriptional regulator